MSALRVVERLDVIEHIGSGFSSSTIDLSAYPFGLHGGEEAFHRRVVTDLPSKAHAAGNAFFRKQSLELIAGVLASLV